MLAVAHQVLYCELVACKIKENKTFGKLTTFIGKRCFITFVSHTELLVYMSLFYDVAIVLPFLSAFRIYI